MKREKILVLDFGGQYTQLIAKAVRKCNVFSEIQDCNYNIGNIIKEKPKGIILSGGPDSVYEIGAPHVNEYLFELGIPILGICYGMQHINHLLGGGMLHGSDIIKEYGKTNIYINNNHPLFSDLENKITAWMSHGDSVDGKMLAKGFKIIASTDSHTAAIADDKRKIYGIQFHPEVTHTPKGLDIISNFAHNICGCGNDWTMGNYIEECKEYIKNTVGENDVIYFVSGGVDSAFVAAVLAQTEGIGKTYALYIDGLMRKHETEEVEKSLKDAGIKDLIIYRAEDEFIKAVEGMHDPEEKRKAIGNLFGDIQQRMLKKLNLDHKKTFLAQGTLYTDLIESGKGVGKNAANIKSHHNVGCKFIEDMKKEGKIVEPNRLIFKDEVREAAREVGLPVEISERQPFPGPGLGIRIVNGLPEWINDEFYRINDKIRMIAEEEGLQGYALPIKTVGVQGDGRTYSYLALLKGKRDWKKIRNAAKRIPTEIHNVNRIVYDISNDNTEMQSPDQYLDKLIPTTVCRETVDLLKEADYKGRKIIEKYGFDDHISQTIFVLFGSDIYSSSKRSIALRAVSTDDFMTVSPVRPLDLKQADIEEYQKNNALKPAQMSWQCLNEIHDALLKKYDIGAFVIDVTDKPPATTCWE
ncbi:MAG: glutamine-hydrolyzing GMP synthase [Nanoarchaeota archaeon]|nr:glutamine-hydrolyzing GMP synthase [Nanoarchaeota archaeon]